MRRMLLTLAAALAVVAASDSSASAQGFGRFGGAGLGFGSTNIFDLFSIGRVPTPPTFALTPPVYYSAPVPRTYGYSPFYYPGDVRTPELAARVEPLDIINPYVPESTEEKAADSNSTVQTEPALGGPLVIENPYFKADRAIYQVSH